VSTLTPVPRAGGAAALGPAALHAELPADLSAPGLGRALLAPLLGGAAEERAWEATVLVGELVANAVVHSHSREPVRLEASAEGTRLYVEVGDGGAGVPMDIPLRPTLARPNGRGLAMVGGLADRWGVRRLPSRVWFEMDLGRIDPTLP
jgi:anti-sigma regulatory factor (Ser/Thr protein kinase)